MNANVRKAMKQLIHVKSHPKWTEVIVTNAGRRQKARRFASIDEALEWVLPRGNRHTEFLLNGYPCVLNGWVV